MIAIVVARCDTQRQADRLASRFSREHDRTYLVDRITRAEFERRPFAIILYEPDGSAAALASLEVYTVTERGLRARSRPSPSPMPLPVFDSEEP